MQLIDYYLEFAIALRAQLVNDQVRWEDEWKKRPIEETKDWDHQNMRIFNRIEDYYMAWSREGEPIPWLKVAGLAFIAWVREQYPDTYTEE